VKKHLPSVIVGVMLLTPCVGIFVAEIAGQAPAAKDQPNQKVLKLAAAIKDGKKEDVKKLTKELTKLDHDEIMSVYKPHTKAGIVNPKAADMGYIISAVAEVALAKGPPADKKELKKDWDEFAVQSNKLGISLADAVKKGLPIQPIADKINNNCVACHRMFK
jgi:hypothetical protein